MLPMTTAYKDALRELNNKKMDIWEDLYTKKILKNYLIEHSLYSLEEYYYLTA